MNKKIYYILFLSLPVPANILTLIIFQLSMLLTATPESEASMHLMWESFHHYWWATYLPQFFIPSFLTIIYSIPIIQYLVNPQNINNKTRVRILNYPLIVGFISVIGWLVSIPPLLFSEQFFGLKLPLPIAIQRTLDTILAGGVSFVFTYYALEITGRTFIFPDILKHVRLKEMKGLIPVNAEKKIGIFIFAVVVVPGHFFGLFLLNLSARSGSNHYQQSIYTAIIVYFLFSFILGFLLIRSYQKPLTEIQNATNFIKEENYNLYLDVASTDEVGHLSQSINEMAAGLADRQKVLSVFGKVVDPRIRDELLKGNLSQGGKMTESVILYSDIRGFTSFSESRRPDEIVAALNRYFQYMSEAIDQQGGIINKYIGDALLALFGVPVKIPFPADAALKASLQMNEWIHLFNKDTFYFENGIGLHAGEVLAGNIGSRERMEYTVIGDAVNLASRVEGLTKTYGVPVLLSFDLLMKLNNKEDFIFREIDSVLVKGRSSPVRIFECIGEKKTGDMNFVKEAKLKIIHQYEEGLSLYREGKISDAKKIFIECLGIFSEDKPSELMIHRINQLEEKAHV